LKRPRDSLTANDASKPLSKAEKKKNKKQKLQDGTAAASGEEAAKPAKGEAKDGEKADEKRGKDKKDKKTPVAVKELPSGLKFKDSTVGTGPMAKKGQTISMRYIGKLTNGKIFDSNTKGKPVIILPSVLYQLALTKYMCPVHFPSWGWRSDTGMG
jgi:FK506-binding nuclear protein